MKCHFSPVSVIQVAISWIYYETYDQIFDSALAPRTPDQWKLMYNLLASAVVVMLRTWSFYLGSEWKQKMASCPCDQVIILEIYYHKSRILWKIFICLRIFSAICFLKGLCEPNNAIIFGNLQPKVWTLIHCVYSGVPTILIVWSLE